MNDEIKNIFSSLEEEKHYVPCTKTYISKSRNSLNVTAGQNANWTYANFFILPQESNINNFSINEGQFVVKFIDGEWTILDYARNIVAKGFEEIKSYVDKISQAEQRRLNYIGCHQIKDQVSRIGGPRQIIFYGAPGTGKSFRIKEKLKALNVPKGNIIRTTFHPDSDYSTFVGAYKPTRGLKPLYGLNGTNTVRLNDGKDLSEEVITYKFVAQAFTEAYIKAYQKPNENVYLVIEEINRGNCAQIFGDLFQLLDRDADGKSEYTIKADDDLRDHLEEKLGADNAGIAGGELCLPSNLFIYATMNTSDQSLFPIDSAFKRRWDWEYEPIKYNHDLRISIADRDYKWTSFQKNVNALIKLATSSEDKMLGDYFVNPANGVIDENTLRNKVLFYLWNDVCKDGEGDIFKVSETDEISFSDLYGDNGTSNLINMMDYLKVEEYEDDVETPESQNSTSTDINNVKFSFNEYKKIAEGVVKNINTSNQFNKNGIDIAFPDNALYNNPRLCLSMNKSRSQAEVKLWISSNYIKKDELFAFLKENNAEDIIKEIAKDLNYREIGKNKSQDKKPVRGWAITIPVNYDASDLDKNVETISQYLNELKSQFAPLIDEFNKK